MGYTEADAAADAAAADLAEQEAIAQDARLQALEAEQKARERREFEMKFARIFDGIQNQERLPFLDWVIRLGEILEDKKFSKSAARLQILKALAYCPEFKIDLRRDGMEVYDLIDLIVPPADAPGWGTVGRPKSLRHRIYRMVEDGLLKAHGEGRMTETLSLTPLGAFHAHQSGPFPSVGLLGYFRWHQGTIDPTQGRPGPTWDNPFYSDFIDTGTVQHVEDFQLTTPGASKWPSLRALHEDPWEYHTTGRLEEYDFKLRALKEAIQNIYEERIDECLKVLEDYDRYKIIEEVLIQSGIDNDRARDDLHEQIDKGPYASRFTKMAAYYQAAHPDEDGGTVVAHLIVRSAWVVVRQVLGHRMNDDYSHSVVERAKQGDPSAIQDLDEYRALQGWIDPEEGYDPEDYYEPDEDIARGR